jgi:CheY-like chemotaxis protein
MHSLSVMIVEDEPLIAMMMEALVEDVGGVAHGPYANLNTAIAAIESGPAIDVALLDCNLGRERSWPVADALAARGIPFAFTSGQGVKEITERFANRPVFAKPVDEEKLKRFLQQHIRQG